MNRYLFAINIFVIFFLLRPCLSEEYNFDQLNSGSFNNKLVKKLKGSKTLSESALNKQKEQWEEERRIEQEVIRRMNDFKGCVSIFTSCYGGFPICNTSYLRVTGGPGDFSKLFDSASSGSICDIGSGIIGNYHFSLKTDKPSFCTGTFHLSSKAKSNININMSNTCYNPTVSEY